MKVELKKEWIRYFEYESSRIYVYPKKDTPKAIAFYLLDPKGKPTNEIVWVAKSLLRGKRSGIGYHGLDWIFDEDENQEKLVKIGYRL